VRLGASIGTVAACLLLIAAAACAEENRTYVEHGQASWYGDDLHGRPTASGEPFDQSRLTAAHPDLPLGARVEVTNLESGRSVEVEINDRGPAPGADRAIDLSKAAAAELGMLEEGTAPVRIEAKDAEPSRESPGPIPD
jgi:rare lipoprotein A